MGGDRRLTAAVVAAAVLLVIGVVAAGARSGDPAPVDRWASVAGGVDSVLPSAGVTTTAPAPVTTRPPTTTLVTSTTVGKTPDVRRHGDRDRR
jgi:hypothetical protein